MKFYSPSSFNTVTFVFANIIKTGRRAKALLINGNIQSVPSAGFGFYVPSL
ncbi:hypothetical protein [Bacillus toyonensis]|uniref:hypothetical protein n=1 Tax=Bacillus toyonensis TaxID=155322 RepID=UPI0015CF5288|nr:hypothetical protein [Bacillus toyonensis]